MKIGIVGSNGYIAGYLIERLKKENTIIRIDKSNESNTLYLDLETANEFDYNKLKGIDYIIFTAAISGPDKCATDYDFCWKINVEGTKTFISKAIERNCKVLFFSSDAVFGNIEGMIYDEESKTNAKTPYGIMKKEIEDTYKAYKNFKAIRLSYVVSCKDRFVSYCMSCIKNNETAEIFHPFYRNCISVSDVVDVVEWMINHWNNYDHTFLNVTGKELVSRVRIADEINRIKNYSLKYKVIDPGQKFYEHRPKITQMKSLYLKKYEILEDDTFSEKIQKELEEK